ncbi:MAG: AI-2E family transporter [Bacteroidales bacterium]|nr:AI-2E family transporter [Bacteroidales bacterium]MCF8388393.1 AI-2E family transporter [Bacteroidales bacterium]MCF8399238.1 AI-2E family transporter [Bacteroidales bacterium]
MFKKYPLFFYSLIIILTGFLVWYYSVIVAYVLVAAVLSIIGRPIVHFFEKLKFPHILSVILTMLIFIIAIFSFFAIFVPLFIEEAHMISKLDFKHLGHAFQEPLSDFEALLKQYNILGKDETIGHYLGHRMESLANVATFSGVIKGILSATGSFFIGLFSTLFITLFFLKDENLFANIVLALTNKKHHEKTRNVLDKTNYLLQRYFTGLITDVILMITLMSIAMTIFGIHNSLLIGFFAGLVIVIPYVGPIIGATVATIIGVTSALSYNIDTAILPLTMKILAIYFAINIMDGLVFQPLIYGKFVKASPLEIFLVILISGSTGGIIGMIIAVPAYTVLRIIAKEFFSQFRPIEQLTRDL